jgi:hypothetical protein
MTDVLFQTAGDGRETNDALNKAREEMLAGILYRTDDTLTPYERELKTKWQRCLWSFYSEDHDEIRITQKAGRRNNYDFMVNYMKDGTVVHSEKIEFKHNTKDLESMPQFLSLSSDSLKFDKDYAEYYYDNYLRLYVEKDSGITVPIPEKAVWLKKVGCANYHAHPFFQQLKDREEVAKVEKSKVVDDSITAYLETHGPSLDLSHLADKFKSTQAKKQYVLWDLHEFRVAPPLSDFDDLKCVGLNAYKNSILVNGCTTQYKLLLRWKNHKGVLYPAWQISLSKI